MIKYIVKFIFDDGSELVSNHVFDSLRVANEHCESMLRDKDWNTPTIKVIRYVVGTASVRF